MWRSLFVGLVIMFLLCALKITTQAQMYWESGDSDDETISSGPAAGDDQARRSVPTRGSVRMYDYTEAPELEVEAVPQPSAAPVRSRVQDTATQDDASRSRSVTSERSPARTPSATVTSPRPAVTTPGTSQAAPQSDQGLSGQVETKRPTSVGGASSAEQPATKKMRWGQGDTGSPDPGSQPPAGQQ